NSHTLDFFTRFAQRSRRQANQLLPHDLAQFRLTDHDISADFFPFNALPPSRTTLAPGNRAFSVGSDGGRRSPDLPAHSGSRLLLGRLLINAQIAVLLFYRASHNPFVQKTTSHKALTDTPRPKNDGLTATAFTWSLAR